MKVEDYILSSRCICMYSFVSKYSSNLVYCYMLDDLFESRQLQLNVQLNYKVYGFILALVHLLITIKFVHNFSFLIYYLNIHALVISLKKT